jgi:hypothetical protein
VRTGSSLSLEEDDDNDGDDDDDELVTVLPLAEEEESSLLLATLRRLMSGSSRSLSLALDDVDDDDDDDEEEARLSLLLGSRSPAGSRLTVAVNCGSSLRVAGDGSFGDSPPSGVVRRRLASLRSLSSLTLPPPPPPLASRASLSLRRLRVLSDDELALRSSDDSLRLAGLPPSSPPLLPREVDRLTADADAASGSSCCGTTSAAGSSFSLSLSLSSFLTDTSGAVGNAAAGTALRLDSVVDLEASAGALVVVVAAAVEL